MARDTSMKCNVGTVDRIVRALLAVILGSAAFMIEPGWGRNLILALAGSFALTAILVRCLVYRAFKWSTASRQDSQLT